MGVEPRIVILRQYAKKALDIYGSAGGTGRLSAFAGRAQRVKVDPSTVGHCIADRLPLQIAAAKSCSLMAGS
jgi:hypothetical protein